MPFPSILEKCVELLKLHISTYMLLTLSRTRNTEFEKRMVSFRYYKKIFLTNLS
jgi:hypothetical protein